MGEVKPQMDEYWIARIQYWPEQEPVVDVIYIYCACQTGEIDFIPFSGMDEEDPIRSSQCEKFKLLERIEVEKYK